MTNGTGVFDPRSEEGAAAKVLGGEEVDVKEVKDPIVVDLQARVRQLRSQEKKLLEDLAIISPQLRRYERALKVLNGEPLTGVKGQGKTKVSQPSRIGPDKLDEIREAVVAYAEDHEEFRQVDIRGVVNITSSLAATAFEQLRQENTIRLARKSGNNKFFRLTREALNG